MANFLSDPALRQRQDQLNSQWYALNATIDQCGLTPSSGPAFSQFYADFAAWKEFYASGSDWTSASKSATDGWQTKLQDYTRTLSGYCQSWGSDPAYIPGVKDPPPDEPSFLEKVGNPFDWIKDLVSRVGIALVIIVALVLGSIVYILVKKNTRVGPGGVSVS